MSFSESNINFLILNINGEIMIDSNNRFEEDPIRNLEDLLDFCDLHESIIDENGKLIIHFNKLCVENRNINNNETFTIIENNGIPLHEYIAEKMLNDQKFCKYLLDQICDGNIIIIDLYLDAFEKFNYIIYNNKVFKCSCDETPDDYISGIQINNFRDYDYARKHEICGNDLMINDYDDDWCSTPRRNYFCDTTDEAYLKNIIKIIKDLQIMLYE